jgi:hypothetical protein
MDGHLGLIAQNTRTGLEAPEPGVRREPRPQAPVPPHVTTPHERAPRVDGTEDTKHI